jgi:hypothetical protein
MRMRRFLFSTLVFLALVGGTTFTVLHLTTAQHTGMWVCRMTNEVQPTSVILSCADGAIQLENLSWSRWGEPRAVANGTYVWNDCTPDCATGGWHRRPITVVASDLVNGSYRQLRGVQTTLIPRMNVVQMIPPPQ